MYLEKKLFFNKIQYCRRSPTTLTLWVTIYRPHNLLIKRFPMLPAVYNQPRANCKRQNFPNHQRHIFNKRSKFSKRTIHLIKKNDKRHCIYLRRKVDSVMTHFRSKGRTFFYLSPVRRFLSNIVQISNSL